MCGVDLDDIWYYIARESGSIEIAVSCYNDGGSAFLLMLAGPEVKAEAA